MNSQVATIVFYSATGELIDTKDFKDPLDQPVIKGRAEWTLTFPRIIGNSFFAGETRGFCFEVCTASTIEVTNSGIHNIINAFKEDQFSLANCY